VNDDREKENRSLTEGVQLGARATVETQLSAYEVTAKAYDQILALQADLSKLANLFFVITGALWAAVATKKFGISDAAALGIFGFHLVASVLTLQVIATNLNGIKVRFEFLKEFRPKFHRDIEQLGRHRFRQVYGREGTFRARYLRWGNPPVLLWYSVPIAGFLGSSYFISRIAS
jgi:hypothetical protein